jgi:hypothetical protein
VPKQCASHAQPEEQRRQQPPPAACVQLHPRSDPPARGHPRSPRSPLLPTAGG